MKKENFKRPYAKKSLGQNFLIDSDIIEGIMDAIDLGAEDTVIEIGPGRGALTGELVNRAGKVIAVEIDRYLVPLIRDQFAENDNFSIIEADALEMDYKSLIGADNSAPVKLAANLPYYISTAILQKLAEQRECFSVLVLMLQKEVAEKISAEAGNSDRGFLTVMIESAFRARKLFDVSPKSFRPAPKVWSSVVLLESKETQSEISKSVIFRKIVSAGFRQKRKTITNNLKYLYPNAKEILEKCGIEGSRRSETLTLEEWERLASEI